MSKNKASSEPAVVVGSATTGRLNFEDVSTVKKFIVEHKAELDSAGVTGFEVYYSGEGDEGQVEDVLVLYSPEAMADPDRNDKYSLPSEIKKILNDLEPEDSYGDNEGGGGTVTFIVETGKVVHSHYDRVIECSYDPEVVY